MGYYKLVDFRFFLNNIDLAIPSSCMRKGYSSRFVCVCQFREMSKVAASIVKKNMPTYNNNILI